MNKKTNQFFYPMVVMDSNDPLMIGRVRARLLTQTEEDITNAIQNPIWNPETDKWTRRDPCVFLPLLPNFFAQVPQEKELVYAFYYNNDFQFQNQFYVQATFSSPTYLPGQYYEGAKSNLGLGIQLKESIPLRGNDGEYINKPNFGVFPEPKDIGLLGRGNADLIIKEDGVLIRAGKTIGSIIPGETPAANNTRSFLQVSQFQNLKVLDDIKTFTQELEKIVLVKYLIEWTISNPENTQNKFSGNVYLYKLKPNVRTNSQQLKVDSDVEEFKFLIQSENFVNLTKQETISFINEFIKSINDEKEINGKKVLFQSPFPFFYRPSPTTYNNMTGPATNLNQSSINNLYDIYKKIYLNNTALYQGYGLVYTKNKIGYPFQVNTITVPIYKYNQTKSTFGALGGDDLVLLSHKSAIPGKAKINFDGTLYGISNDNYTDEILPNTSSMVRGEELLELLNLIVRFLITHTHSFPGLPPVSVTQDGSNVENILSEMQNAVNKILNQNIRLN